MPDVIESVFVALAIHHPKGISSRKAIGVIRRIGLDVRHHDLKEVITDMVGRGVLVGIPRQSGQIRYQVQGWPLDGGVLRANEGLVVVERDGGRQARYVARYNSYVRFGDEARRGTLRLSDVAARVGLDMALPPVGQLPLMGGFEAVRVAWRPTGHEAIINPCDHGAVALASRLGTARTRIGDLIEGCDLDEALMLLWAIHRLTRRGIEVERGTHARCLERRPSYQRLLRALRANAHTETELVERTGVKRKYARELLQHMVRHKVISLQGQHYKLAARLRRRTIKGHHG